MKAAFCTSCTDIVAPFRNWAANRAWRWCQCDHVGVRWRDGTAGLLEVTSKSGAEAVRVLGLNNAFLEYGVVEGPFTPEAWRELHEVTCQHAGPGYLFSADERNCWALIVRPGESGDVFLIDFAEAKGHKEAVR